MPRHMCQFCGGSSRTPLQISPIDPTLKLCSSCVRFQRQSMCNDQSSSNKSGEEKKGRETARKKTKSQADIPVKKEKHVPMFMFQNRESSVVSAPPLPIKKKKKTLSHEKKEASQFKKGGKKRKFDDTIKIQKSKKKIKLSSIFEPKKKYVAKREVQDEGQLRKGSYHGVFWNRSSKTWAGKYSVGGKTYHVTSGKNEKKVAKEVRKAVRLLKKEKGLKPKKPYGKLKEVEPKQSKINSSQLSATDAMLVPPKKPFSIPSESLRKPPIITTATTNSTTSTKLTTTPSINPTKNIYKSNTIKITEQSGIIPEEENQSIIFEEENQSTATKVKAKRKIVYKGVSWSKRRKCWVGQIPYQGERYYCKASKNASIVAESVRKKAAELRKQGLDIPKGYGTKRINKHVAKDAERPKKKVKKNQKENGNKNRRHYYSSSESDGESSGQLTSSYDWKELKKEGRKYNTPLKSNELFSITLNWNEMLSGKTLEDGQLSSSGSSSSDNAGYF